MVASSPRGFYDSRRSVLWWGGVNSLALLLRAVQEGSPPDIVIFADTGAEMPHTYESVKEVQAWLEKVSPKTRWITTRWIRQTGEWISLEEQCVRNKELPSKAYGYSGCTSKWKQQPIDRVVYHLPEVEKELDKPDGVVIRWIGYDADEPERLQRMLDKNPQPPGKDRKGKVLWDAPLVAWDMGREECVELIKRSPLTFPGKSSCFFCPSMRKSEILEMGERYPDLLQRALDIEQNASLKTVKGLGRSFAWRGLIVQNKEDVCAREEVAEDCTCGR